MTEQPRVFEARIVKVATVPRGNRLARWRRWRWSVTRYRCVETIYSGVQDGRVHLWGDCGYTFTWLGAAVAVAWEITKEAQ